MGLDTQIERTTRMPGDLNMKEVELEQQPGTMTEEEEVTSGEEEQLPELQEKPRLKASKSMDSASQKGEKLTQIKKKFSILSLVEFDPVTTAPGSPTSSTSSTMGSMAGTTFLNMESLLATDLLQRKLSMMSMPKLMTTVKSDEEEEAGQSEK